MRGTSRLFEAGFAIEQVSLVTGHKDWKMLRRTRISARKRCTGSPRRAPPPRWGSRSGVTESQRGCHPGP